MQRSLEGCCVAQTVVCCPDVKQARGLKLGAAPHGGLCLVSDSSKGVPEDLDDFYAGFSLYIIKFVLRWLPQCLSRGEK
jgi:hypothetical protein